MIVVSSIRKYQDVDGFAIYGNDRYIYQYISEKYPQDEVKFDISKIKLVTLDIETTAEKGFPDVESASGRDSGNHYSGLHNQEDYHMGCKTIHQQTKECYLSSLC